MTEERWHVSIERQKRVENEKKRGGGGRRKHWGQ